MKERKCLRATGSSPIGLYELLRNSDLDFSDRISVNLDEYVGLAPTDEHSYHYFMKEQLFDENHSNIAIYQMD